MVSHALEGRLVAEQKQIEQLHGGGIASEHYHGCAGAAGGTDGAEYAGRFGALILRRLWPGCLVLLTNPDFILPPDL
ncbi:MAG: hypothetical protein OSB69_19890 [Alphaproteobacteria bacterium]|nr:hypothetical protein [Alphaproteobacteria bacterium]